MTDSARTRAEPALHRIAAVARVTGVSEHLLRIWERRYGSIASARSEGGYRLYSDQDIARVHALKALLDSGYAIGDVAHLSLEDLVALRTDARSNGESRSDRATATTACDRFIEAIARFDVEEASRVLASAVVAFAPFELADEVVAPLLRQIGERWKDGRFTVAHEHAATAVVRSALGDLLRAARPTPGAPLLLATTPDGEHHELGALLASVVAAYAGARVLYLGPNTSPTDVAHAAAANHASAVLLSIVSLDAETAAASIVRQRRALSPEIDLWVGGAGAKSSRSKRVVRMTSLVQLRDRVRVQPPHRRAR